MLLTLLVEGVMAAPLTQRANLRHGSAAAAEAAEAEMKEGLAAMAAPAAAESLL